MAMAGRAGSLSARHQTERTARSLCFRFARAASRLARSRFSAAGAAIQFGVARTRGLVPAWGRRARGPPDARPALAGWRAACCRRSGCPSEEGARPATTSRSASPSVSRKAGKATSGRVTRRHRAFSRSSGASSCPTSAAVLWAPSPAHDPRCVEPSDACVLQDASFSSADHRSLRWMPLYLRSRRRRLLVPRLAAYIPLVVLSVDKLRIGSE